MPQLPPVAAAVFVFCLLVVIVTTTVVVQIRSRRRRMRLAQMVRATAPVPRPTVSTAEQPLDATLAPLRGQSYHTAEQEGRFRAFAERPGREPAPGRPARRLAARVAYAAPVAPPPEPVAEPAPAFPTPAVAEAEVEAVLGPPTEPALPTSELPIFVEPDGEPEPLFSAASHAGLTESALDISRARMSDAEAFDAASVPPPLVEEPRADAPVVEELAAAVADREPVVVAAAPALNEPREPESAAPPRPSVPPVREPQITVLSPRPAAPALPALMTREVTLGDAARVLRGALPGVLTMTDGRHTRRAVAVGVATSVVAAAFAIRGRRR